MRRHLSLFLTLVCISMTGCGSGNVDGDTEILVKEAGTEEKNASEMEKATENMDEEITEPEEPAPETKHITIDLLEAEEIHAEGDAVEPLKLKILSEEENGVDWANDWYESKNLSLPMIGNNWDHFYDDEYEYQWFGEQLNIYEKETGNCLYVLEYPTDKWYVNGNNAYLEDGIFYGASVANGYANPGSCFMFAYDLNKDVLLWRSADQSYNTMNFIVKGDVIICGYGFTDEKDYLYQINKNTGEIIDKMELRKQPDLLVEQDGKLYLHAYSYNYVIDILEDTVENSQKETIEDLKQSLAYREEEVAALEESIMNDPYLTQTDLNEKSHKIYEIWDITLNEIWEILKRNMSEEDMSVLMKEQLDWIAMKEASMKEAEKEVEGGSMYGMVVSQRGASLTKERVYELMEMVEDFVK